MFMPPRFYKTPSSTVRILNFIINGMKERHRIKLNVTGKKSRSTTMQPAKPTAGRPFCRAVLKKILSSESLFRLLIFV